MRRVPRGAARRHAASAFETGGVDLLAQAAAAALAATDFGVRHSTAPPEARAGKRARATVEPTVLDDSTRRVKARKTGKSDGNEADDEHDLPEDRNARARGARRRPHRVERGKSCV